MSKTAIIYSGQARTFAQLWENHRWHVWRKFTDPHFFISVEADMQAEDMKILFDQIREPRRVFMETVTQPTIVEPVINSVISGWKPSSSPQAILRQLWSLNRAYQFFQDVVTTSEGMSLDEFDTVIRIRPDTHFIRLDFPKYDGLHENVAFTPWWSRWGGVNDRFAILGSKAAKSYFTTYQKLEGLFAQGAPLHPETLVHASLETDDVLMAPLSTEFRTLRLNGSMTPFDPTEIDIADYARSRP